MMQRIFIIGLGLIGGSIALGIKHNKLAKEVVGFDRDKENLNLALKNGAVNIKASGIKSGAKGSQFIIIATPVRSIPEILTQLSPVVENGTIVTDVGSVKKEIVELGSKLFRNKGCFVGGHPVAGTENSGFAFANDKIFLNHRCVLISKSKKISPAARTVEMFWNRLGCDVVYMTSGEHDEIFAGISHLPHMIAYSLVNTVSRLAAGDKRYLNYVAGGFKDFTRIASSNPRMWTDIAIMNRKNILRMIKTFEDSLSVLKHEIRKNKDDSLINYFSNSKETRDSVK